MQTNWSHLFRHETKRHVLRKFLLVLLLFVGYFFFIAQRYGLENGFLITLLTWSFFVLCTPVADAGFLIAFPLRLITKLRMLYSQMLISAFAIVFNTYAFFELPELYEKTKLLSLFQHILAQPVPFWTIILLSGVGTFLSVRFGDELMDTVHHSERKLHQRHKHTFRWISMVFLFGITLILYNFLLKQMGVTLPL